MTQEIEELEEVLEKMLVSLEIYLMMDKLKSKQQQTQVKIINQQLRPSQKMQEMFVILKTNQKQSEVIEWNEEFLKMQEETFEFLLESLNKISLHQQKLQDSQGIVQWHGEYVSLK